MKYRGFELIEEPIGAFAQQSGANRIKRYKTTIDGQIAKGTEEELTKRIDDFLGPEQTENSSENG